MTTYDYIDESNASYSTKYLSKPSNSVSDEFEVLNPLQYPELNRCDANVISRRNFIFEMDKEPLENQKKYVQKLKNIINRWVFSGSKSIHMRITISYNPDSIQEYKYIWNYLNNTYFDGKADRACSNPARLTRKLNGFRIDKRKKQVGQNLEPNILDVNFLHEKFNLEQTQKRKSRDILNLMNESDGNYHGEKKETILETLESMKNKSSERWQAAYNFASGNAEYEEGIKALSYLKWLGFSYDQIKRECEIGSWNFREDFYNSLS